MHPRDLPEQSVTTLTLFLRFQRHIPATLLLVQSTQKNIHLMMKLPIRMIFGLQARLTLAFVNCCRHCVHLFWLARVVPPLYIKTNPSADLFFYTPYDGNCIVRAYTAAH